MDHFSLGATTTRQNVSGNNSSKFRISPVSFSGPTVGRQNNNGFVSSSSSSSFNGNNNNSHHNLYNFGTSSSILPPPPHSIFSRAGGLSANFINPNPPNHFNFPLRSNVNGSGGSNNNSFSTRGGGTHNNGSVINHQQNQNLSKNRPNNNYNQQHNGNNSKNQTGSSSAAGTKNQQIVVPAFEEPLPQYRIFKRGDSIPGIMSPPGVLANNGACGGGESSISNDGAVANTNGSSDQKLDISNCSIITSSSSEGNQSIGLQDKENNAGGSSTATTRDENSVGNHQANKTAVSQVGDIARFHNLTVEYRLVSEKGPPHSPTFSVQLFLGPNENYVGSGSSIKRAQHAAAVEAIEKTPLSRPTTSSSSSRSQPKRGPFPFAGKRHNWALLQLTTLAEELKEPVSIVQQPVTLMNPFHRGDPPIVVSVHVGPRIFSGEGNNFNTAKNMALMIALKAMIKVRQELEFRKLGAPGSNGEDGCTMNLDNKSPISVVHEMAMQRDLNIGFDVTQEEGPPHSKVFTVKCILLNKVGGEEEKCSTEGQGPTKQAAKKVASELMIAKFGEMTVPMKSSEATSLKAIQRGLFRQKSQRKKTSAPVVKDLQKVSVSPISRLIQIAHIRKYKEPEFTVIDSTVNSLPDDPIALKLMSERERRSLRKKKPSFTIEVSVGPYSNQGTGPNKKAAKKAAAEAVLIEMGYGPTETTDEKSSSSSSGGANNDSGNNGAYEKSGEKGKSSGKKSKESNKEPINSNKSISASVGGGGKILSARQIVPGVLVLNSDANNPKDSPDSPSKSSAMAQEMRKMNSSSSSTITASSSSCPTSRDGIEKLAYLAKLLDVTVSYSDFPKKNEFLSVVSIGTAPPQVAHGTGQTVEAAQNMAATRILEDLSDIGIDNVQKPGDSGSSLS